MATRSAWLVILVLTVFGGPGCGGSDPPTAPSAANSAPSTSSSSGIKTLTATYNGISWTATVRQGVWLQGNRSISGHDGQGRSLNISALGINGPGTYSLAANNPNTALATWVDGNSGSYSSQRDGGSGTLILSAVSLTRVAGSFSFVGTFRVSVSSPLMIVTVANGQFDLSNP